MTDRKCSVHFKTADSVQISVILMWLEPSELELQIAGHPTPSFLRLRKISRRIVHDLANTRSVFNLGPPILNCTRLEKKQIQGGSRDSRVYQEQDPEFFGLLDLLVKSTWLYLLKAERYAAKLTQRRENKPRMDGHAG